MTDSPELAAIRARANAADMTMAMFHDRNTLLRLLDEANKHLEMCRIGRSRADVDCANAEQERDALAAELAGYKADRLRLHKEKCDCVLDALPVAKARVAALEAVISRAYHELEVEEVDPDDCRESVLTILRDALASAPETPAKPLEYGRCINWPCALPHGHIGPCSTSEPERDHTA